MHAGKLGDGARLDNTYDALLTVVHKRIYVFHFFNRIPCLSVVTDFVCWLNILNKSDEHFLPFCDSFLDLEAHIQCDLYLKKIYIYYCFYAL